MRTFDSCWLVYNIYNIYVLCYNQCIFWTAPAFHFRLSGVNRDQDCTCSKHAPDRQTLEILQTYLWHIIWYGSYDIIWLIWLIWHHMTHMTHMTFKRNREITTLKKLDFTSNKMIIYPPVIQHGLLENHPVTSTIFPTRKLHL